MHAPAILPRSGPALRLALGAFALLASGALLAAPSVPTFADDLAFLQRHSAVMVLSTDEGRARLVVAPAFQGRVMTSTAQGPQGLSHGWINRPVVARGPGSGGGHPYGGEDRFWLAPMGSQFSLFYPPAADFDDNRWRVPAGLDEGNYTVVEHGAGFAVLRHSIEVENFRRTRFTVEVTRRIEILPRSTIERHLGLSLPAAAAAVGFESVNTLVNRGEPWKADTGMLSIWILGMFPGRDEVTVVAPLRRPGGLPADINHYLAPTDTRRFALRDGVVFFRGDGRYRSKFGILPRSTGEVLGSYDPAHGVLTVVAFTPLDRSAAYPNGFSGPQPNPWEGDVVSSYNDGPLSDTVGPSATFYELESCSPVKPLRRGESITHTHRTFHFEGPPAALDPIAIALFGVPTSTISTALR